MSLTPDRKCTLLFDWWDLQCNSVLDPGEKNEWITTKDEKFKDWKRYEEFHFTVKHIYFSHRTLFLSDVWLVDVGWFVGQGRGKFRWRWFSFWLTFQGTCWKRKKKVDSIKFCTKYNGSDIIYLITKNNSSCY